MKSTDFQTVKDIQELLNLHDLSKTIQIVEESNVFSRPSRLDKPRIIANPTVEQAKEFVIALETYETRMLTFKKEQSLHDNERKRLNILLEEFISEESGLNDIPEASRSKVWSKAYAYGHSSGYYSVYQELCELVALFK